MRNKLNLVKNNWKILSILIFSFFLRIISINQSFWLDEATSASVVKDFKLLDIITKFAPGDFHPPFYYLSLKMWSSIFPFFGNEISLRMFSVLLGVLSVYFLYKIGKLMIDEKFGLVVSLLLAISPLHLYYSQEARMYVMETFFVILCFYYYLTNINKEKIVNWVLLSLSLVLLGFTDYLPLCIIPVFFIHSFLTKRKKEWYLSLLFSMAPLIISFVIWLPFFTKQLVGGLSVATNSPGWWNILGKFNFKELALILLKFITGRISIPNKLILIPVFSFYFVLLCSQLRTLKKFAKDNILSIVWLIVPIILTVFISLKISVLSYFRLIFILPAFYLIISYLVINLKNNIKFISLFVLVIINLVFCSMYLFNSKFHRENWRGLVSFIESNSTNNKSAVLFVRNSQMEAYRYYSSGAIKALPPEEFKPEYKIVWLSRYVQDIFDPNDTVRIDLERSGYRKIGAYDFNGVVVWRYDK